jgi:hypothetical protein
MIGTTSIEQLSAFVGNLSAVNPEVLDTIDFDEIVNQYSEKLGVPASIMRSKEMIAAIRESKANAQLAAQQQQEAAEMIQGAKVLSETEVRPDNVLGQMVGQ